MTTKNGSLQDVGGIGGLCAVISDEFPSGGGMTGGARVLGSDEILGSGGYWGHSFQSKFYSSEFRGFKWCVGSRFLSGRLKQCGGAAQKSLRSSTFRRKKTD